MPVLPEVGSTIVPPGCSLPVRSASSIIASAMRSLIEPAGLARSLLFHTNRAGGIGALALVPHLVIGAEHPAQPNMRRVADRLQYRIDLHHLIPFCPYPNLHSPGPTSAKPAVGRIDRK